MRAELRVIAAQFDNEQPGRTTTTQVDRATPLGMVSFIRDMLVDKGLKQATSWVKACLKVCSRSGNSRVS